MGQEGAELAGAPDLEFGGLDLAVAALSALAWRSAEPPVADAASVATVDGALTVLLVAAYLLTRAWTAVRPARALA
jgi:hypothetical protein